MTNNYIKLYFVYWKFSLYTLYMHVLKRKDAMLHLLERCPVNVLTFVFMLVAFWIVQSRSACGPK